MEGWKTGIHKAMPNANQTLHRTPRSPLRSAPGSGELVVIRHYIIIAHWQMSQSQASKYVSKS